jgi:hypothetical protein
VTLVIAALACWRPQWQIGVELTYFWGRRALCKPS